MKNIALLVSMALVMCSVACGGGDKPAVDPTSTTAAPTDTSAAMPASPDAPAAPVDTSAAPATPAMK